MSVTDLLNDWFESDAIKAMLTVNGVIGTWAGPDEPGLRVVQGGKSRRSKATKAPKTAKRGTMMERFEERWRRRKEQNGGF